MYFCGRKRKIVYPSLIILNNKELPRVTKVDHLGHTLCLNLSMEADSNRARGSFMTRGIDIRDNLHFATPYQKMQGIQLYCCDAYGSMLWKLSSKYADSFFRAWNIQARLAWNVPRETHVSLVESYFCKDYDPLRVQVFSRYRSFLSNLGNLPSKEVKFLFFLLKQDKRSGTERNVEYLNCLCQ